MRNRIPPRQQGDLFFRRIFGKIPARAVRVSPKDGVYVLAAGEGSGHTHRITQTDPSQVEVYAHKGLTYIHVKSSFVTILHNEHQPINLIGPNIVWRMNRLRIYDVFRDISRRVED